MSVFLSTDDGRILLADVDQRRTWDMVDLGLSLTGIALAPDGTLYAASDTLVYQVSLSNSSADPIALVSSGGIIGLDVDALGRQLVATADGVVQRLENDGSLSQVGTFPLGITGGIARIGDMLYAANDTGILSALNMSTGVATEIFFLGLGPLDAISVENGVMRLTVSPGFSQPQFYLFDPTTLSLSFENGLLGQHDDITGATFGTPEAVFFQGDSAGEQLIGTALGDLVAAADGDDFVFARAGDDTISGGGDDDFLFGEDGDDVISGDDGDDIVQGDDGNDILAGGIGDDLLNGSDGDDTLKGGDGDDSLNGGIGVDWGDYSDGAATVDLEIIVAQDTGQGLDALVSVENLFGSNEADALMGNSADNVLRGSQGRDTLHGRDGDDTLRGGGGQDELRGDGGDDVLRGGQGFDTAVYWGGDAVTVSLAIGTAQDTGGAGFDELRSIEGLMGSDFGDNLSGNGGKNRIEARRGDDTVTGAAGDDTLFGQSGNDDMKGGTGADSLRGGLGDDKLDGGRGAGVDTLRGGDGADTFIYMVQSSSGPDSEAVIEDFDVSEGDIVNIVGATPNDFGTWGISNTNDGVRVNFGNGSALTFEGLTAADVDASWFT
ncbi:MAG: calcium-binding protein [Pseudomonadota bacterium]